MSEYPIRILAAIMFTDMVGYTAMMQENEGRAKHIRDKHRNVLEDAMMQHNGRILQYYGDGTLSIFGSVIEAVKCAIEIQKKLLIEPRIPVRIGIHAGDIVYDDDGVYGDAVNVTSRIETKGIGGSVLISERVYDEIRNHPGLDAVSLGKFELKNVKKPVEIFAIKAEELVVPSVNEVQKNNPLNKPSVAVLPFINMSADPENEYFSDGITEEILNALTKVEGLLVTSRTSSFAFKGKNEDIRDIGKHLNVTTVIEGSVRKSGERVRVTAQLINTNDGYHEWSETYDRHVKDIFEVQDEISRTIANKLRQKLAYTDVSHPLVKAATKNIEAYNLMLKARYYWNKWTPMDVKKAISIYEEAIELDKSFSPAYSGIASCYIYLGAIGFLKPTIAYPRAKEYALKAMELDDSRTENLISIALVQLFYDWDWEESKKSFDKAFNLGETNANLHYTYSLYLTAVGKTHEALTEMEIAYKLDPLSLPINGALVDAYFSNGRIEDAIEHSFKILELDPNFRTSLYSLGFLYLHKGDTENAFKYLHAAQEKTGDKRKGITPLGFAYAVTGQTEKALECIKLLKERESMEETSSLCMDFAIIYTGLKDYDKVFHYLEIAFNERLGGLIFLAVHPNWRMLHNDPRMESIMNRMGLSKFFS
ncbi:MAG: guanylate cyclase [Ignavibacteriales bacterium]|nr:MAG: guanylate cyclase [Ignavibacteriales bacterium]